MDKEKIELHKSLIKCVHASDYPDEQKDSIYHWVNTLLNAYYQYNCIYDRCKDPEHCHMGGQCQDAVGE